MKEYIYELSDWINDRKKDLNYSLEQFDKLIVTLASGGLIFTTGFVKDIVTITNKTDTFLLKLTWYCLAFSLVLILFGQIISYMANKKAIKITQDELTQLKQNGKYDDQNETVKNANFIFNCLNKSVNIFNITSLSALLIGIILFIIFINANL